ncbi:unnamed protein product [Durusdinium trenchii]|uniref:Uncharacterized protein n=2 Tax=Durusdinium trenchii TaxID=1381693 RepID=A0ABP0RQD8_9DINO
MTRLFVAMVMMTSVSAVRFETAEGPSMCDRQLRVKDMEEVKTKHGSSSGSGTKTLTQWTSSVLYVHYQCYVKAGLLKPQYFVRSHRYSVGCEKALLTKTTTYTKLKWDLIKDYGIKKCTNEEDYEDLEADSTAPIPVLDGKSQNQMVNNMFAAMDRGESPFKDDEDGLPVGAAKQRFQGGAVVEVEERNGKIYKLTRQVSKFGFSVFIVK